MDEISVSKFKATCLSALDRVKRTGQPLLVTRRGEPLAEVVPPRAPKRVRGWLGSRRGTGRILADLTRPVVPAADWDALRQ